MTQVIIKQLMQLTINYGADDTTKSIYDYSHTAYNPLILILLKW